MRGVITIVAVHPFVGWQGLDRDVAASFGVTRREGEVLGAVVERLSNAEIAAKLFISERTAESHVSSLLRKLSARDRVELIERARSLAGDGDRSVVAGSGSGVPLPGRLGVRPSSALVGRDAELEMIGAALARVASGAGREVIVVSGEAGVGKTTVLAAATRHGFDAGACVLFGHGEAELTAPYQLFAESLGHLVSHASQAALLEHVAWRGAEVSRLVPALSRRLPELTATAAASDAESERLQMFVGVAQFLDSWSGAQPVVLVLDDLQWADPSSLSLLRHLVAAALSSRVLILTAFREPELPTAHPVVEALAELHRHPGVTRVELAGLDRSAVRSLVEAAGHPLDDAGVRLADALHADADGNAFFVSEVLRNMAETNHSRDDPVAVPSSVRIVIESRVARLGERAQRVLGLAAVMRPRLRRRRAGDRLGAVCRRGPRRARRCCPLHAGPRGLRSHRQVRVRPCPHPALRVRGDGPGSPGPGTSACGRGDGGAAAMTPRRTPGGSPATARRGARFRGPSVALRPTCRGRRPWRARPRRCRRLLQPCARPPRRRAARPDRRHRSGRRARDGTASTR